MTEHVSADINMINRCAVINFLGDCSSKIDQTWGGVWVFAVKEGVLRYYRTQRSRGKTTILEEKDIIFSFNYRHADTKEARHTTQRHRVLCKCTIQLLTQCHVFASVPNL